jgi:hypothetical protein
LRCRHDVNLATGTVGYGRSRRRQPAPGDEFATGDELRAADAAHLEHRIGEQRVQRLGVRGDVRSGFLVPSWNQVALTRTSPICAASVSVLRIGPDDSAVTVWSTA